MNFGRSFAMHTTGIQNRSFEAWLGKMKVCFFFTQVTVINFMKNIDIDVDHGTAEYLYSPSTFLVLIVFITTLGNTKSNFNILETNLLG